MGREHPVFTEQHVNKEKAKKNIFGTVSHLDFEQSVTKYHAVFKHGLIK